MAKVSNISYISVKFGIFATKKPAFTENVWTELTMGVASSLLLVKILIVLSAKTQKRRGWTGYCISVSGSLFGGRLGVLGPFDRKETLWRAF